MRSIVGLCNIILQNSEHLSLIYCIMKKSQPSASLIQYPNNNPFWNHKVLQETLQGTVHVNKLFIYDLTCFSLTVVLRLHTNRAVKFDSCVLNNKREIKYKYDYKYSNQ